MAALNKQLLVETARKIRKDKFFFNSSVFFIGSFLVGLGNYLYQFLTARMLTVEVYGELQSVLAILAVTGVLTGTISTVLIKYAAGFKAKGRFDKIHYLFSAYTQKILIAAMIFFAVFVVLSGCMAKFLNLDSALPLIILGIAFFFGFSNSVNSGILQGLQKFKELSAISLVTVAVKILATVLLIKIGFGINGAVGAVVLAAATSYLISFYPLKSLLKQKKEQIEIKEIFQYSFPVFFTLLFTTWLYNIDVILVKHFFTAQAAGEYGALSMLGHIIFLITGPITGVMFSMAAHARGSNTDPAKVFKKALLLVGLIGFAILFSYFILPGFIVKILIGSKFLAIGKYLGWFGVSMFLYSLVSLFTQYFLSVGKTECAYSTGIGALLQVVLISVFHNSLWQVVWTMNGVMLVILLFLAACFFKMNKYEQINLGGNSGL
jgi:O-antigen/teichoic acid export membrane protein